MPPTVLSSQPTVNRWSAVASPNATSPLGTYLKGVACASATDCWAVGNYSDNSDTGNLDQTIIEHWNGSAWTFFTSPNPGPNHDFLNGVTCVSSTQCWAVGYYYDSNLIGHTLIALWNGTAWSQVSSPDSAALPSSELTAVTCLSASNCWAAGFVFDQTGFAQPQTLIENWDGTAWSVVSSPNTTTTRANQLRGVACSSASQCWAVGFHNDNGGLPRTLIEQWNGSSWAIVPSGPSSPPPGDRPGYLNSVSCVATSECRTVGSYKSNTGYSQTLIEHWNGAGWVLVASPNTNTHSNALAGVTCTSPSQCWAVGSGANASFSGQPLIERWDGNSWTIFTSPSFSGGLGTVTCVSASNCWAAGNYYNGTTDVTLIEEYLESPLQINSIVQLANGHVSLQCLGVPNSANSVQVSFDLSPGSFGTVATPTADSTGAFSYQDASPGTKKFYRLSFP